MHVVYGCRETRVFTRPREGVLVKVSEARLADERGAYEFAAPRLETPKRSPRQA